VVAAARAAAAPEE